MGFSSGSASVQTTVKVAATIPPPGNAVANSLPATTPTPSDSGTQTVPYGTSPGKADVYCVGQYQLAAGASITLNLYNGGATPNDLTRLDGTAANLRNGRQLFARVVSGGDSTGVAVGGAGSNPWYGPLGSATAAPLIYPDGPPLPLGSLTANFTVTATAKNLLLTNNSPTATATVNVFVVGVSVTAGTLMGLFPLFTYA
jgi:hypothetical protein